MEQVSPTIHDDRAEAAWSDRTATPLRHARVIGLLNNNEIFGQERANIQVFIALRELGADVQVGVNQLQDGGDVGRKLRRLGFRTFSLPFGCQWSKQFLRKHPTLPWTWCKQVAQCSRVLSRQIKDCAATHVHLGNPLTYSYVYGALKTRDVPLVYRMGDEPPSGSKPNLLIWRSCFRRASRVVANSEFVRSSILRLAGGQAAKVGLVYNHAWERKDRIDELLLSGAVDPNKVKRVMFMGQIAEHKGLAILLEAVFQLMESDPSFRLEIVGGSVTTAHYEQALRSRVAESAFADRIQFHGYQADPISLYCRADLLVVPSLFEEPAANVVIEAKQCGVPSVVFPSGGLPELVTHQKTGYVCRSKTKEALVEGLRWYLDHPERLNDSRVAARQESATRFGVERFRQQWGDVYCPQK